jgi:transposase
MSVVIGIDPHKALHAACAIDTAEVQLDEVVVRSGPRQLGQLLQWAAGFEQRTWAIESAGGLGYLLAQQLLARGEVVVDVPATLSSRARLLSSGRSSKNDANDAHAVAVAALRSPSLSPVRVEDHVSVLRMLAKAQFDLSHARSRACSRLHALVSELVAGGIGKEVVVSQGEQLLAGIHPVNVVQRQRLDLALELLDEIRALDTRLKASKRRITDAVSASATSLIEIFGVGPIIAAIVIGYTGDIGSWASGAGRRVRPLLLRPRAGVQRVPGTGDALGHRGGGDRGLRVGRGGEPDQRGRCDSSGEDSADDGASDGGSEGHLASPWSLTAERGDQLEIRTDGANGSPSTLIGTW